MPTIKDLVLRQLEVNPDISLKDCQKVVPKLTKPNFYKIKRQWVELNGIPKKRIHKKTNGRKGTNKTSSTSNDIALPDRPKYDGQDLNKFILEKLIFLAEHTDDIRSLQALMNFSKETGQLKDYKTQDKEAILSSFKSMDFKTLSQHNKHLTSTSLGSLSVEELKEKLSTLKTS